MAMLKLTRGLPASGKTTYAREWVAAAPLTRVRVNRDDLRKLMFDAYVLTSLEEDAVTVAQRAAVSSLLKAGKDVIVDDTNLSDKTVKSWYKIAFGASADVVVKDIDTPVEVCVERNATREKAVDESVIRRFAQRYLVKGRMKPPPTNAYPPVPRPYVPNTDKPRAWLCDLDGTLFHMDGRSPYEWHRVGEDTLDASMARLLKIIGEFEPTDDNHPDAVILVSGRDASCRVQTEDALRRHGVRYDALIMRPAGDMRADNIVKLEIFDRDIRDNFWVQAVFDDRNQVVDMWRSLGVPCYQVAEGDF